MRGNNKKNGFERMKQGWGGNSKRVEWKQVVAREKVKFETKIKRWPWLVWLSGLGTGLQTKGLLVRFPVRAHA